MNGDLPEPWLDKRALAVHLGCSVRSIQYAMTEGMPSAEIFGRRKFRVSEVEPWLEQHGHLTRAGDSNGRVLADNKSGPAAR